MKTNIFNSVEMTKPNRNVFDLTHDVKMSGKIGELIPCLVLECVPGDRFDMGCDSMIRFAPMLAPIMHRVDVSVHYFFVPNRIIWPGWEKFIVGDPDDPQEWAFMSVTSAATDAQKRFLDYLGVPPIGAPATPYDTAMAISALPACAYQKIYNDYYRDENLIEEVDMECASGVNALGDFCVMRRRAWEHDYFTSSLPWAQKGAVVDIPLGQIALSTDWTETQPSFLNSFDPNTDFLGNIDQEPVSGNPAIRVATVDHPFVYDPDGSLTVQATSINDLRTAYKLQEWLERNARGGTRYNESVMAHFGVRTRDSRLQRPEYITGTKAPVIISEVLNTTGPTETWDGGELVQTGSPQGDMAGHGISVGSGKTGSYFCEEHGIIMGIMSVMPKPAYQQGIPRMYQKSDYLDYFFPTFAHLGEQAVTNGEIFAYQDEFAGTFGYVPRYAEYKYMPSRVAGDFRTTLNFWHMGRIFATPPALNQNFIECFYEEVERVFAVQDGDDHLWCHLLHRLKASRLMPKFGSPGGL